MSGHDRARLALRPYTPEIIARIDRDYPQIEWATVDPQHDVAAQAPQTLVAAIRKFAAAA
jgi:hypothetical protein